MAAKFDIKALAIAHGEKAVLGIVVVLIGWFLYSARWSGYERHPAEFTELVTQGKNRLASNDWGQPQVEEHTLAEDEYPTAIVQAALEQEFDVSKFQLSTQLTRTPFDHQEPLKLLATADVRNPIADAGYAFLQFPVEEDETEGEDGEGESADEDAEETPSADEEVSDEFLPIAGAAAGGTGNTGAGNAASARAAAGTAYSEYESMYANVGSSTEGDATREAAMATASNYTSQYGSGYGYDNLGEGQGAQTALNRNGKLYPYVSVRAVFDVREQIRKIQEATHLEPLQAAAQFRFLDFRLERRTEIEPGLWSEWEPVQIQVAKDVLDQVDYHAADVVSSAVTDPTITMPLPSRIYGAWSRHANHPDLVKFTLTPEQLEREIELNRRLLDEYIKTRGSLDSAIQQQRSGGFADVSLDTRQMQSEMMGMGSGEGYAASYMQAMGGMGGMTTASGAGRASRSSQSPADPELIEKLIAAGEGTEEQQNLLREYIEERVTSDGQLMLFRYIDFDVRPGETYQYRVQIEIANPNYQRRASEAGGIAEVVETESRWTDWSEPTPPARLAPTTHYYLTQIEPAKNTNFRNELPIPRLAFYQRSQTLGSMVHNAGVEVRIGGMVGGTQETEQYDAAKAIYTAATDADSEFRFSSNDFLVAALPDIELSDEHVDVDAPPRSARGALRLTEAAVVVDDEGNLRAIDPVTTASERTDIAKIYNDQITADIFKAMREATTTAESDDPYSGEGGTAGAGGYAGSFGGYGGYGGQQSDSRRIRRGGGRGARGAAGGAGPPMPVGPGTGGRQ
jgi:hypothetical protein